MKIIIYNAISIDGFIARENGDSDWVSEADIPFFEEAINKSGCIIVGRTTFEQYEGELYPVDGLKNIVITSNPAKINTYKNVNAVNFESIPNILEELENEGISEIVVAGGGKTNTSFLKAGLVDEIIIDIHPLFLGNGIKQFEDFDQQLNLEKISERNLGNNLFQIRYKVIK